MSENPDIVLEIKPSLANLAIIRNIINSVSECLGMSCEDTLQFEMAVDEACANSIASILEKEGDTPASFARLQIGIDAHRVCVQVLDTGDCFKEHYENAAPFDDSTDRNRRRGYGLQIIKTFMDEVDYIHEPGTGNRLVLTKYLTGA